jgi:hypothetical protein
MNVLRSRAINERVTAALLFTAMASTGTRVPPSRATDDSTGRETGSVTAT